MPASQQACTIVRVPIPARFAAHADAALTRLGYLHPAVEFALTGNSITAAATADADAALLRRDISYALYREKIYAETLAIRHALVNAVTRR
jgi:hypothetical protein